MALFANPNYKSTMTDESYGHTVKERRARYGLSQRELARRANLSAAAISQIESGRHENPRKDTVDSIEAVFVVCEHQPAYQATLDEAPPVAPGLYDETKRSLTEFAKTRRARAMKVGREELDELRELFHFAGDQPLDVWVFLLSEYRLTSEPKKVVTEIFRTAMRVRKALDRIRDQLNRIGDIVDDVASDLGMIEGEEDLDDVRRAAEDLADRLRDIHEIIEKNKALQAEISGLLGET